MVKKQLLVSITLLSLSVGTVNNSAHAALADKKQAKTTIAEHARNSKSAQRLLEYSKRACQLWQSKLYTQAHAEALEACRLFPNEAKAHTNLAAISQSINSQTEAINQYKAALRIDANNLRARIGLAQCLAIIGSTKSSLSELAIAAKSSSAEPQLILAIGQLYFKLGRYQLAKEEMHNCLSGLSSSQEHRQTRQLASECLLLSAIKTRDIELAERLMDEVFVGTPSDLQVYTESAKYVCTKNSTNEAMQILTAAIRDKDYCAQLFYDLAKIFESKAGLCLESADISDHKVRNSWINLAEQSLRQCVFVSPNDTKYRIALAGCLDMQNKSSDAAAQLTSVAGSKYDAIHLDKSDLGMPSNNLAAIFKNLLLHESDHNRNPQSIYLRCARFKIDDLSCGCRLNLLESRLRAKYGVVCVSVFHDGSNGGLMIYNPKKTTFATCINRILTTGEKVRILCDSKISTIEQLAFVLDDHAQAETPLVASIVALPPQ